MTNKNFIVIIIAVALVFFVLGYVVSSQVKPPGKIGPAGQNTFQAGWEAAKKRLAETETGFTPTAANTEIKTISGEIKEIKGNKISLKIRPLEPLADPELDNRVVIVDDNTKIYQLEPKDPKVYQKELEDFNKKMQEQIVQPGVAPQPVTPPEYFTKKQIKLADLKIGQQVTVAADKDIKNSKEFKAIEISLQSMPITPAVPPTVPPPAGTGVPAAPSVPPLK